MTFSPLPNSDGFTASAATLSGSGSRDSDSEPNPASQQYKPSTKSTSPNGQADNRGRTTTFGTPRRRPPCSMACVIQGPFNVQSNGGIGQTICDADGRAISWTTDEVVAQVICRMLNDQEGLHG